MGTRFFFNNNNKKCICLGIYIKTFLIINENVFKDHWLLKEITDKRLNGRPTYNP